MAILDHGIGHFLMGLNPDSGGPPFRRPSAFWWKLPDGRRLFVWLGEHYGSVMAYLQAARDGDHFVLEEVRVRAAQEGLAKRLKALEAEMEALADELRFEEAAAVRDRILELKGEAQPARGIGDKNDFFQKAHIGAAQGVVCNRGQYVLVRHSEFAARDIRAYK